MAGRDEINVLVLNPNATTRFAIATLAEEIATKYRFILQDRKTSSTATIASHQDYLEDARETVVRKGLILSSRTPAKVEHS